METQMVAVIWSILFYLIEQLTAQLESSMGMRSNLDDARRKDLVNQCPGEWQFPCRNGECIARYDACDGIAQCSDGSDEWNCDQWRQNNGGFNKHVGGGDTQTSTTTTTTTTAMAVESGFIVLSTREVLITFAIFAILAVAVVMVVRRRARMKVLARNRRGNLLQKFQGDSDEDDILISSMYS
uniref:Low-density lipoprotein receptor domain class A n=1 Tax=Haemonchus contortus TaxID=6289 RepID=A0A7I4XXI5_HAECO